MVRIFFPGCGRFGPEGAHLVAGCAKVTGNWRLATGNCLRWQLVTGNSRGLSLLLVDVGFDDLRGQARCQLPVLAAFEERHYDDFWIAAGGEAHEPAVLGEVFVLGVLGAEGERNNLG